MSVYSKREHGRGRAYIAKHAEADDCKEEKSASAAASTVWGARRSRRTRSESFGTEELC